MDNRENGQGARARPCTYSLDPETERLVGWLARASFDGNRSAAVRAAIHHLYGSPTQSAGPSTLQGGSA